ncbi:SDR family oxidoreductase [soil metagenome]
MAHLLLVQYNTTMRNFANRVAAVTGAGSGIGRSLAAQLAGQGCHLALSDIDATGLAATAAMLGTAPVTVTTSVVDVADRAAVDAWAKESGEAHGRVNLIINNAGVAMAGSVQDTPVEDYEWLMDINFWGVVYGTKAFLPLLREAGEGHVVNISSIFGLFSSPSQSAYNAAKFAVRGFTESLRQELDIDGGTVSATCVHPGGIATNIAKNARLDPSANALLDTDVEVARDRFEKVLRTSADDAARAILKGVRRNARRVLIGPDAKAADLMQRSLPTGYQALIGRGARILS